MTENKAYLNTQKQLQIIKLVQPFIGMDFEYSQCDCHTITATIIDSLRGTDYLSVIKGKYHDVKSAIEFQKQSDVKLSTVLHNEFQRVYDLEPMDCLITPMTGGAHVSWYLGDGNCLEANNHIHKIIIGPIPDLSEVQMYRLKDKE